MRSQKGFYSNWIALRTLIHKELTRFMRIWPQTLFPPVITMSLYFIIFGKFIGAQIQPIEGYAYIQYLVPGLVLMSMMTNAYANSSSSFFLAKFTRDIEEMLVSPMSNLTILLGFMLGGMVRGLLVGLIVLIIGFFFTHIPFVHPLIILSIAILSAMVFSLGGLINGIYAKRFDDISFIPTFVLTPLTYLGGVFYSTRQLPPFWRKLSLFNPIFSMVDTFRFGILGVSDLTITYGFTVVLVSFGLLFFLAWFLLSRGVGVKV